MNYYEFMTGSGNDAQVATPSYEYDLNWRFCDARVFKDWPDDVIVDLETRGREPEDLPFCVGHATMLSNHVRDILLKILPSDHVEFLNIHTTYDGIENPEISGRYCLANWLHTVDCNDEGRAGVVYHSKYGYKMVQGLVLRREAIPKTSHVFRVEGYRIPLVVSQAFLQLLSKEKIRGWWTLPIHSY